ncbi:MAG: GIY-YIG nuclease family protein [Myxococcota bacterium]
MRWYVYLVRCRDGSLYTGCTNDLERRLAAHNAGRGARYTQARRPVTLVYAECARDRSQAQSREAALKRLPKVKKESLVLSAGRRAELFLRRRHSRPVA